MNIERYYKDLQISFIEFAMDENISVTLKISKKSELLVHHNLHYERIGNRSIFIFYNELSEGGDIYESVDNYDPEVICCNVEVSDDQFSALALWNIRKLWLVQCSNIEDVCNMSKS